MNPILTALLFAALSSTPALAFRMPTPAPEVSDEEHDEPEEASDESTEPAPVETFQKRTTFCDVFAVYKAPSAENFTGCDPYATAIGEAAVKWEKLARGPKANAESCHRFQSLAEQIAKEHEDAKKICKNTSSIKSKTKGEMLLRDLQAGEVAATGNAQLTKCKTAIAFVHEKAARQTKASAKDKPLHTAEDIRMRAHNEVKAKIAAYDKNENAARAFYKDRNLQGRCFDAKTLASIAARGTAGVYDRIVELFGLQANKIASER